MAQTRNNKTDLRLFLQLFLMLDALAILLAQLTDGNPWFAICMYWVVLTVKNGIDLMQ